MPDLTRGYQGNGRGNLDVVNAILKESPLNVALPGPWLAKALFANNFMPYAKSHWTYHGTLCNCEDLSSALWAVWNYVTVVKRPKGLDALPAASKVACTPGDGLITKAMHVFAGPAHGNVRLQPAGLFDGRCLFPIHWVFQVGAMYFDPTFDRSTASREDIVERRILKSTPALWIARDRSFLYVRNLNAAPQFSDSWNELKAAGWLSAADWKTKTARTMHSRSKELVGVDRALQAFEQQGMAAFQTLKTAFSQWAAHNPREATARNHDNCVRGLAGFLGVPVNLRP